ncbi:unnamed protein product [Scytosiphon promiscuus]
MGGVSSATSGTNTDQDDEDFWDVQHQICSANLDFFRNWKIEDVEIVKDRLQDRVGQMEYLRDLVTGGAVSTHARPTTQTSPKSRDDYEAVQIQWHEFFHAILCADAARGRSARKWRQWHVATRGYAMVKDNASAKVIDGSEKGAAGVGAPGHTDDEASDEEGTGTHDEFGDENTRAESGEQATHHTGALGDTTAEQSAQMPCTCDAAVVTPVFFGYMTTTKADIDAANAKEKELLNDEEVRIIEKQRLGRISQLARDREEASKRREAREKTVATLEAGFERGRKQRMLELQTAKKAMATQEYELVLKQWDADEVLIMQAHEAEVAERKNKFAFLNREDSKSIQSAINSAKHTEKAETSKVPRGAQLEGLARGEIERLVGEIDAANKSVKLAQDELLAAQELRGKKGEAKARQVVETSLILLEGRATASEKVLDSLLEQLREAEFMLGRSQRIRYQEDLVLPLYEPLATNAAEGDFHAPLFSVLCGLAVASNDTLWEKLAFITNLFAVEDEKIMDKEEMCAMLATLAHVLNSLKMLKITTSHEELVSLVTRAFLEGNLDYRKGMTNYEVDDQHVFVSQVKSWMVRLITRSSHLSDVLGSCWSSGQMSMVMRCKMSMVHEFELGMISMVDLKHKVARKLIKYRTCLQREHLQIVHDRALARGDDDPTKPDYSRFLRAEKKASFSNAIPLHHGHLANYSYWREMVRLKAATKIQNVFRGKLARQAAEKMAKKHAFLCARAMALEDTRQRISAEIWKREAASGVGRLKWDAKVRIKQAKLRATGGNVDRQKVVEVMVQESVQVAQDGVVERFGEIAKERGFQDDVVEHTPEQASESDEEDDFLTSATASRQTSLRTKATYKNLASHLISASIRQNTGRVWASDDITDFGRPITPRKEGTDGVKVESSSKVSDTGMGPVVTPVSKGEDQLSPKASAPMADSVLSSVSKPASLGEWLPTSSILINAGGDMTAKVKLTDVRKQLMTMGLFPPDLYGIGESFHEIRQRKILADADPPVEELAWRVGSWDTAMTRIKTNGLLAEFPTKRLLMQYAQGYIDRADPPGNLQPLFDDLAKHFQISRNADQIGMILANVLATDFAFGLAAESLEVLRGNQEGLLARMAQIEVADGMAEAETDYTRRLTAAKLQGKSVKEVERNQDRSILEEVNKRVKVKYLEITNVCNDFLEMAKHLATTVIDERNFEVVDRTLCPVMESDCHGRSVEGNRGHAGKRYKFEAFNIRLKVCVDDHGLFNGDDECAAKGYGGRELLGALEYMKQHQPAGLNIPLTCVIDYHGFRVLAVAKVPIITTTFARSGKIRRAREDMIHGTTDAGGTIRNESRVLSAKLQTVAERLNLSFHMVKGVRELNSTALWANADLRGYRTDKNIFYLLNFWRAFPSEDPAATPHLEASARGQSVMWRGLRPELVRSNPVPLSPDANMLVTHDTPDWRQQRDDVLEATRRLVNEIIPSFAEELCRKKLGKADAGSGYGISLTADMHRRGIGVRHIGLLRDMFWRPLHGSVDLSFNSNRIRTKTDMRLQLCKGDQVRIDGDIFTVNGKPRHEYSSTCITLDRKVLLSVESMNIVTGSHQRSDHFWNERILPIIRKKFGELAVDHAEDGNLRLLLRPCIVFIIRRLQQEMLGFTLSATCSNHFCNRPWGFKFTTLDISNAPMRIKHNAPMKEVADASVLVLRANKARATDYVQLVRIGRPELYLTFQERKGSRVAVNHGQGGISMSGYFSGPIKFERPGPIANDPLNRAVSLQPATNCYIDTKDTGRLLAPMRSHLPFSVEAWAKCNGGLDTTRYVLMSGRYSLLATRENIWATSVCTEDGSELYVLGPRVEHGQWAYLVATYDGLVVRMYVNGELVAQVELYAALEHARSEKSSEQDKALAVLHEEENRARERCKVSTEREFGAYCKTREGEAKLSRAAHKLREKAIFASQLDVSAAKKGVVKMSKANAKARARLDFKTEMYMRNVQKVARAFKLKRDELQDLATLEREEVRERAEKPLRIGAMCRCKRSKTGRNFFSGDLCHVAVYLSVLPVDTIRAHHFAGVQATAMESDRLYVLAGVQFEAALALAPDDIEIISRYAQSVVNYLELESMQSKNPRRSQRMVEEAVEMFIRMENWDGLAVIFTQLPAAPLFAGSFCRAFNATLDAFPDYFASSMHMPLKNLARMPKKFYLDLAGADEIMTEVAAAVYRLVLSDVGLADTFGKMDLSWLPMIKSAPTVVATVLQAESGDDERVIDLEKYHLDCSDVQETDVIALINNRRLAVVLNLAGCKWVTDWSMEHVAKVLVHLQAFTVSGCHLVSDQHVARIVQRNQGLTVLGLSRCPAIGSLTLVKLPSLCKALQTVDLSHNANVTDDVLGQLARCCRRLGVLYLQYCVFITDVGVQTLAVEVNHATFTSLDLSGCVLVSDHSIVPLGRRCRKLRRLNLKALNRVTEEGASSITYNCWDMEYLCLEDMYNLMDSAFVFYFAVDGRRAVEANMLVRVTEINLHDCNKLTDTSVDHIMKRACRIRNLNLAGCCHLTDMSCTFIAQDPSTGSPRGDSLTSLNLGYCLNITDQGVASFVASLRGLQIINLAGCVQLTDDGILTLVSTCTRLQELVLAQCKLLTDKSLCYLADFLWVERLDISFCSKVSDDGIEVVALEFAGLRRICLKRCIRLTGRTLDVLSMYCLRLEQVDIQNVPNFGSDAVLRLQQTCPQLSIST